MLAAQVTGIPLLQNLALTAVLVFFLLSCSITVFDVLFGGAIDVNRLVGAGCIYLLSGSLWGIVYFLLNVISPASISRLMSIAPPNSTSYKVMLQESRKNTNTAVSARYCSSRTSVT